MSDRTLRRVRPTQQRALKPELETKMAETMTEMSVEQEQEARAADEIREETKNRGETARPVHPALVAWLGARDRLFSSNVGGDLKNAPERHPDVMLLKRILPQSSLPLHIKLAWLCWRARQVRYFHPGYGARTHTGASVMSWADAVISANDRDVFHEEAMQARTNYYASRPTIDARREQQIAEEEALALTLMRLPTNGHGPATDFVKTAPQTAQDKAKEQAEVNTQRASEAVLEAQQAQALTQVPEAPAGVTVGTVQALDTKPTPVPPQVRKPRKL